MPDNTAVPLNAAGKPCIPNAEISEPDHIICIENILLFGFIGRTYRYFDGKVQYPFGYGLTYTTFCLTACSMEDLTIRCMIKNTGEYLCDEVLQVYVRQPETAYPNPIRSLIAVRRFTLRPGEEKEIAFLLSDEDLYSVNEQGDTVYLNGLYTLTVSDGQSIISEPIYFENRNETVIVEKCPL